MKSFLRLVIAVIVLLSAVFAVSHLILNNAVQDDTGRPYRVEAARIARKIEAGETVDLNDYRYITHVEALPDGFAEGESDYLVKTIGGVLYRFDYYCPTDNRQTLLMFDLCFGIAATVVIAVLAFVCFRIIRPFDRIKSYPTELAKGNLTLPLKEQRGGYTGQFLWGLDLLRETLENRKASELALQKQNKTMLLSLSHDIKTPLSVIELYAKALERGLYDEEQKKKEIAVSIHDKCEEIRLYVDDIARTAGEDFLQLEVTPGEFYLSELMNRIRSFYTDKLRLLQIGMELGPYADHLLGGDPERAVEVLQNLMENAVKYGDGQTIAITFSQEEDCQLIHVANSGCTLSETELPHIFESFWRGSNVGSQSGSGLGLYICRTLMRKMNGDIYAAVEGEYMVVTAVFPIA